MATVGNTSATTAGWNSPGSGYAAASAFTMPGVGGYLNTLHGYFDAISGSGAHGWCCVWDNSGNLIASVDVGVINNGSASAGGQQYWSGSVGSVWVAGGASIWIGFYCNQGLVYSSGSGGGSDQKSMGSGGPGSFAGHSASPVGVALAYADYTPLAAPTVTSATPNVGVAGTSVVVAGTNLLQTSGVTIGGAAASFVVNSDTQITATVPAGAAAGLGSLVVTTPAGTASVAFTVGTIYGDNASAWQGGVLIQADDGTNWQQCTVWVDDGTNWQQVG